MKKLSFLAVVVCVAVSLVLLARVPVTLAQTSKGTVTGTVTDPSGAVIPNASVTLTQKETNAKRDTKTNGAGIYRFEAVDLGTYTLAVKAEGFGEAQVADIVVANQVANFDVQLKLGSSSQTVSVEAGAVVLQTTDAVRGGTFEPRAVTQLPLQGQDSINLMLLLPGVQNASTTQFSDGSNNYSVNGQRARANNFMIDGVENNDISVAGAAFQITNNDAIQEVSVQTSNFSAEYGRAGGAVVNQITKSGTNAFHGTAAEVYKSNVFNATSNSDRLAGLTSPAKFNENIPAFTVGGPVYIPHLYDGRNKTFFFGAGQWDRFFSTATRVVTAPIAGPTGVGVLQALAPSCPNVALYLQALGSFVGSGITPQTISIAAPSGPTCDGTLRTGTSVQFSNATRVASQSSLDANHLVRIDQIVSNKQTMSFRWLYDSNTTGPSFNNLPGFDRGFNGKTMTGLFTDTYVFGPRWTNEFRFNYGRIGFNFPSLAPDAFHANLANFGISGITGFGVATNIPQFRYANNWQYQDTVSATFGRHTWRFGADFLRQLARQLPPFNGRGSLSYAAGGGATALANFIDDFGGGNGKVQRVFGNPLYHPNLFRQAYFVQDDFKATKTLTLNLGLRYENFGQPANGFQIPAFTNYDPVNFLKPDKVNQDNNNFGPAVGFAWAPAYDSGFLGKLSGNGKLVWRGGFQISYDAQFNNLLSNIAGSSPNVLGALVTSPKTGRGTPNFLSQQFTNITPTPLTAQSPQNSLLDPNLRNPYTERWSFGFERELPAGTIFGASYVGSEGHKLYETLDMNPIVDAANGTLFNSAVGPRTERCSCANSNYHALEVDVHKRYGTTPVGGLLVDAAYTWSHFIDNSSEVFATGSTASSFQSLPQVLGFNPSIDRGDSDNDRRHRLVLDAVWNLPGPKSGLLSQFIGGWALAPVFQVISGAPFTASAGVDRNGDGQTGPDRPDIGNPLAPLNTRGILVPTIAPAKNPVLCGNWSPTGLLNPDAGTCVTASAVRFISSGDSTLLGLPNAKTVGRNTLRTPYVWQQDMDFFKTFRITERMHLEYRAEIFNLFNRENFGLASPATPTDTRTNIADVLNTSAPKPLGSVPIFMNFGQTEAVGRNMRMGLKLTW